MIVPVLCLVAGGAGGWTARHLTRAHGRGRALSETREGGYRFVNPLLECDRGSELLEDELTPFRAKVQEYLRVGLRFPGVESVSVYFRELNDGIWFSAGDHERFAPASLRKIPMMMALLKQAERDPALLERRIPFRLASDHTAQQTFKPSVTMTPGAEYTVLELIRRMIVYSDNNAFMLLSTQVHPAALDEVYRKLDASRTSASRADGALSVQTYASFLRVLYNASYLGKDVSEWALGTLAQTDFRSGLVKGVPAGVVVAHKFGEQRDERAGKVQLHDCGVVYAGQHPYLLCVMTRGASFEYLDDAIASISRVVYDEVTRQHGATH